MWRGSSHFFGHCSSTWVKVHTVPLVIYFRLAVYVKDNNWEDQEFDDDDKEV